tara:strand:- start:31 stop:471 length:441 start_codon:yes stop_codon:yes gene_type:complete
MPFRDEHSPDTSTRFQRYEAGLRNVGSYQASCDPWLTGSNITAADALQGEISVTFPRVTKSFTVINTGSQAINVHFASRENSEVIDQKHYITIPGTSGSWTFDVKCTQVYVSAFGATGDSGFQLAAELTGIAAQRMYTLTGSGIDE